MLIFDFVDFLLCGRAIKMAQEAREEGKINEDLILSHDLITSLAGR